MQKIASLQIYVRKSFWKTSYLKVFLRKKNNTIFLFFDNFFREKVSLKKKLKFFEKRLRRKLKKNSGKKLFSYLA